MCAYRAEGDEKVTRLPQPGADSDIWGDVLNDYLLQAHTATGLLKANSVGSTQIADNAITNAAIQDGTITEALLDTSVQTKLNTTAPVTSVNSQTGAVTLTKADIALGNVDNTSDMNKPISTATQTALNAKADASSIVGADIMVYDTYADAPALPVDTVVISRTGT